MYSNMETTTTKRIITVLVVGIPCSGKTALVHKLKTNKFMRNYIPRHKRSSPERTEITDIEFCDLTIRFVRKWHRDLPYKIDVVLTCVQSSSVLSLRTSKNIWSLITSLRDVRVRRLFVMTHHDVQKMSKCQRWIDEFENPVHVSSKTGYGLDEMLSRICEMSSEPRSLGALAHTTLRRNMRSVYANDQPSCVYEECYKQILRRYERYVTYQDEEDNYHFRHVSMFGMLMMISHPQDEEEEEV